MQEPRARKYILVGRQTSKVDPKESFKFPNERFEIGICRRDTAKDYGIGIKEYLQIGKWRNEI